MTPEQSLRAFNIASQLQARGVKAVGGLTVVPGAEPSKVVDDLLSMLEAYLAGKITPLPPLGDSVRERVKPCCRGVGTCPEGCCT